jgi:hypothetical protein
VIRVGAGHSLGDIFGRGPMVGGELLTCEVSALSGSSRGRRLQLDILRDGATRSESERHVDPLVGMGRADHARARHRRAMAARKRHGLRLRGHWGSFLRFYFEEPYHKIRTLTRPVGREQGTPPRGSRSCKFFASDPVVSLTDSHPWLPRIRDQAEQMQPQFAPGPICLDDPVSSPDDGPFPLAGNTLRAS